LTLTPNRRTHEANVKSKALPAVIVASGPLI
jgi:hypothetical protein